MGAVASDLAGRSRHARIDGDAYVRSMYACWGLGGTDEWEPVLLDDLFHAQTGCAFLEMEFRGT